MNNQTLDASIPVLTEIIPAPDIGAATALQQTAPEPAQPIVEHRQAIESEAEAAVQTDMLPERGDEKWDELEREIRERILTQVLERIDFVLEQRVRDSLADVLQTAVEGLASDIRGGLHQTIKDVVSRAVTQEIKRLQYSKKQN